MLAVQVSVKIHMLTSTSFDNDENVKLVHSVVQMNDKKVFIKYQLEAFTILFTKISMCITFVSTWPQNC
jgi:hypothetical protein